MEEEKINFDREDNSENDGILIEKKLLNELVAIRETLEGELTKLREQNQSKDETINRLQEVVYQYEKGFISSIKEPIIKDVILFKDSFNKFKEMFSEASEVIVREIDYLNDELEDIFFAHGIEIIQQENDEYDRETQKVRKKISCEKPELNRKIAHIVKDGYRSEDKLLRKQEVAIFIYHIQND